MRTVDEILDKLKRLKGFKNDAELARALGVQPNTVSTWRSRKAMSYDSVIQFCEQEGIDVQLVLTGQILAHYVEIDGQKVLTEFKEPGVYKIKKGGLVHKFPSDDALSDKLKVDDEHRDPILNSLLQRLEFVYNKGTIQQRAMIRGIIEEISDEIARKGK